MKLEVRSNSYYGYNLLVPVYFRGVRRAVLAVIDTAAQISMVRSDLLEGLYQSTKELPIGTAQEDKTITCNLLPNVQFVVNGQPFTHSFASGPITNDCILGLDFLMMFKS